MRVAWCAFLSRAFAIVLVLGGCGGGIGVGVGGGIVVSAFSGIAQHRSRPFAQVSAATCAARSLSKGRGVGFAPSRREDLRSVVRRPIDDDWALYALFGGGNDSGSGGGGGDTDDPNPGGLRDYGGSDDDNDDNDIPFLEKVRLWLRSNEGRQDVQTYCISFLIALALRVLIIEPRYIPSLSMYPTFEVGDQLAIEKVSKRIRPLSRKEIVVFRPPQTFRDIMSASYGRESSKSKEALIKRIVAVAGDEVRISEGRLYINGEMQEEPYVNNGKTDYDYGPVNVPPGNVFVLGDNRNESMDGHIWGFLPQENVIGRAVFTYWPPWRIGSDGMY